MYGFGFANEIEDEDGKVIGEVTSGTMSPSLEKGIGLGYVPTEVAKFGNKIFIKVRKIKVLYFPLLYLIHFIRW